MRELARAGNAIFIGRGAVFATVQITGEVHIRLVASDEDRVKRVANRLGISKDATIAHNQKVDVARRACVKKNFDAYSTDPKAYDLVINTSQVPMAGAVEFVKMFVHARSHLCVKSEKISHAAQLGEFPMRRSGNKNCGGRWRSW